MICPIDSQVQCPYEELLDAEEMTCEGCEVCEL